MKIKRFSPKQKRVMSWWGPKSPDRRYDAIICDGAVRSGKTLCINDDSPLLSLRKRESRYGVISQVLIQDKVQGVRHPVVNREFTRTGGQRRHVLYMPRSTAEDRRYTGEYQIEQSALEQVEIDLELPVPFAAMPGDRVELSLDRLHLTGTYEVVRSRSRMDGDGERTELTVSRR